jgi:hypothetical protein
MRSLKFLRAWRVFLYAVFLINVGSLILNALVGTWFAILPAVMIVALVAVICLHAKTIARREYLDRPQPDYPLIAAMEKEIYGKKFKHAGAPSKPPGLPLLCVHGHGGAVLTRRPSQMCKECERRREIARDRASAGIGCDCGSAGDLPCYCDQIHYEDEHPANLRWERRS